MHSYDDMTQGMEYFFRNIGIKEHDHILVHSSFRNLKKAFPGTSIKNFIENLQDILTPEGSLILPAFTYCFKKINSEYEVYDRATAPAKTGAVADVFRTMPDVIRTSSPTHSFSLWGKASAEIGYTNLPISPLGNDSPLDWLANKNNSFILMAGVNFTSFSFGHFIEVKAQVPWKDYSPWDYLNVLPIGVSTNGETELIEVPGCAKSFVRFEDFLVRENIILKHMINGIVFYYIPVKNIVTHGFKFFAKNHDILLCPKGTCNACDARHLFMERLLHEKI